MSELEDPDYVPLQDPDYVPLHPPVNGLPPVGVERWGARSQVRWFGRFRESLRPQPAIVWSLFFCESVEHRGVCCSSCVEDELGGYGGDLGRHCCCRAV